MTGQGAGFWQAKGEFSRAGRCDKRHLWRRVIGCVATCYSGEQFAAAVKCLGCT